VSPPRAVPRPDTRPIHTLPRCGSVARGLADEHSDIGLDVYWASAPTEDERITAVEGAGWARVYAGVDEMEWADGYAIDGVKIG